MNGLAPLMDWLQNAARQNTLPKPHQFTVPCGSGFWHVDLALNDWGLEAEADPSLPRWNGKSFDGPTTQPPDSEHVSEA